MVQWNQGSNSLHFFYGADGGPAVVVYNGASYGYIKEPAERCISIVNSSGTEVVHYVYDAWGRLLSKTGTLATTLGTLNPFRYRGYVFDEETGLYYPQNRYYNPAWGRFINADAEILCDFTLWDAKRFTYCANNSIRHEDTNGNGFWDALQKVAEAALVVAAVALVAAVVIGTGGGAGFGLVGGGALANATAASTLVSAATVTGAAGATLLLASKAGCDFSGSKQKKGTPRNNQAQNKQFDEAGRELRKNHNINMTQDKIRRLHNAVSHRGYDLQEIIETGLDLFGG